MSHASIGRDTRPKPCTASQKNSASLARASADSAAIGWITPISLLTSIAATSAVSIVDRLGGGVEIDQPVGMNGQQHAFVTMRAQPQSCVANAGVFGRDRHDLAALAPGLQRRALDSHDSPPRSRRP